MNGTGEARDRSDPRHVFTVDVEEYFQVHAFEDLVHPEEWECFPSRVGLATDRLLQLLEETETRATFFVLGWVAERHPGVVRRIAEAGHEVASHGYSHELVTDQVASEFRADVRRSKQLLEEITDQVVRGYRAPRFSLGRETEWMLDVLAEEGYRYDSSLVPARMAAGGGYPGAGRWPRIVETKAGPLLELPLTTARWAGVTLPAAGGAYLRHLPFSLVRSGFRQAEEEGQPGVFYLHPWEMDPNQPTIPGSLGARIRHYRNLDRTEELVRRVLSDFAFTSARERFGMEVEAAASGSEEARRDRPSRGVGS